MASSVFRYFRVFPVALCVNVCVISRAKALLTLSPAFLLSRSIPRSGNFSFLSGTGGLCLLTATSMALSPTDLSPNWIYELDSDVLQLLVAEDEQNLAAISSVDINSVSPLGHSPVHSPFSDGSGDSGVVTSTPLSGKDELLSALLGPDAPLLLQPQLSLPPPLARPPPTSQTNSTASLPPSSTQTHVSRAAGGKRYSTRGSEQPKLDALLRQQQNPTNIMYEFAYGDDFPVEPTHPSCSNPEVLDKSRKNAEAAKQGRIRKKKYLDDLEKDRAHVRADNIVLKTKYAELQARNRKLENEVDYLRSVLANQSTLASLIKNVPNTPGVNLTSSFSRKRPNKVIEDPVEGTSNKRPKQGSKTSSQKSGGICLHVSEAVVSLEFCAQCSQQAAQSES